MAAGISAAVAAHTGEPRYRLVDDSATLPRYAQHTSSLLVTFGGLPLYFQTPFLTTAQQCNVILFFSFAFTVYPWHIIKLCAILHSLFVLGKLNYGTPSGHEHIIWLLLWVLTIDISPYYESLHYACACLVITITRFFKFLN